MLVPPSARDVLLDANVLLFLVVGRVDVDWIASHRRLAAELYDERAFRRLESFVARFRRVVVTPNVVTETSNLLAQIGGRSKRRRLFKELERLLVQVELEETYVPSADAAATDDFVELGLTDCTILSVARSDMFVLSEDFRLCGTLRKHGYHADNLLRLLAET